MSKATKAFWCCPLCGEALLAKAATWCCEQGHSFDRAKQGYVNLLPVQKKQSLDPGDNQQMIDARHHFLRAGHYAPLAQLLSQSVQKYLSDIDVNTAGTESSHVNNKAVRYILDLGCGEGYYLETALSYLSECDLSVSEAAASGVAGSTISAPTINAPTISAYGIDISKAAVKRAASTFKAASFAVASSYDIPLGGEHVDIAFSVFSPIKTGELSRVLSKNGYFIRALPGPRHLYQLKELLYADVKLHELPKTLNDFELCEEQSLNFELQLDKREDIEKFLTMTPLNWHKNVSARESLLLNPKLNVECDFLIHCYRPIV